jgi:phage baseplate assembly protein gpV
MGTFVELGVARTAARASTTPGGATAARHVQVELVPSGRLVDARVAQVGQGTGKGLFLPVAVGDEVLVAFPGGNPNRGVIVAGLGNATVPNPAENDGTAAVLMHPGGVQLRHATGAPASGIVHGGVLPDLATYITAIDIFMTAISIATTAPQVAAAAVAFQAAVGVPSTLATNLTASAALPGGGPPYATLLHKVTT